MTELAESGLATPVFADAPNGTAVGLLSAAIDVIEDRGETAVRVEEIAGTLGLAVTAVYRYFGSRQGLIDAAHAERVVRSIDADLDRLAAVVDGSRSATQFRAGFERFVLDTVSPGHGAHVFRRVHALGSAYGRPELLTFLGEAQRYAVESASAILGRAQDKGWVRKGADLQVITAWLMAVTFGGVVNLVDPSPVDPDALAVLTVDALKRALWR